MFDSYDIKEIRCLPMDSQDEFINEDEVREFFDTGLAEEEGRYYYHQNGINLKNTDALVLFQYNGNIVAYGIFKTREKEVLTAEVHGKQITYNGYNLFDTESVHNIEKISSEEFRALNPAFKRFSQSMQKTDINLLKPLSILLEKKRKAFDSKK
ncbi:MAG: hypothetical protein K1W39_09505 [Lachnospiraceae bacterium]|jgi:hypothetical protein